MRTATVALLAASVLWTAQPAAAARIGVYNDPNGQLCPQAQPFAPTTWFVLALLAPDACGGISGAEFRIDGVPTNAEGWFVQVNPPPGVVGIGDPLAAGVHFNYPECQSSASGVVVLFTLTVFQVSGAPVVDRLVQILAHQTPSDPLLDCPVLRLCDAPALTGICVQSATTRINGSGFCPCQFDCLPGPCPPLAVAPAAWSTVKQLFR